MDKKLISIMTGAALATMFGTATVFAAGDSYGGSAAGDSAAPGMGSAVQGAGADFSSIDTNADGYISQEEAQAHQRLSSNWQSADTNADNQIDQSEFSAFEGTATEGTTTQDPSAGASGGSGLAPGMDFSSLDTNQDGYISQEEAQAHQQLSSNWQSADTNADNQIDQSEFSAFEGTSGAGMVGAGMDFSSMDVNQDGYISQDEAANNQQLLGNWQSADTDADGRISESEFSAFEAQSTDPGMGTTPGATPDAGAGTGGTGMDSGGSTGMEPGGTTDGTTGGGM